MYPPNVACPERTNGAAKTAKTPTAAATHHPPIRRRQGRESPIPATASATTSGVASGAVRPPMIANCAVRIDDRETERQEQR